MTLPFILIEGVWPGLCDVAGAGIPMTSLIRAVGACNIVTIGDCNKDLYGFREIYCQLLLAV